MSKEITESNVQRDYRDYVQIEYREECPKRLQRVMSNELTESVGAIKMLSATLVQWGERLILEQTGTGSNLGPSWQDIYNVLLIRMSI